MYFGRSGSTKNRTGITRCSSTAKCCGEKQKHSVLRNHGAAFEGEMSGTACAIVACPMRLCA